jgi:hypothetical protein
MLIKILLITLLFLPFTLLNATTYPSESLTIQLQQALDVHCEGIHHTASFQTAPLSALPKQCVVYKITAYNKSAQTLHKLAITGNIPLYAQLKKNSVFVYKKGKKHLVNIFQAPDSAQINVKIPTLTPLGNITVFYSIIVS